MARKAQKKEKPKSGTARERVDLLVTRCRKAVQTSVTEAIERWDRTFVEGTPAPCSEDGVALAVAPGIVLSFRREDVLDVAFDEDETNCRLTVTMDAPCVITRTDVTRLGGHNAPPASWADQAEGMASIPAYRAMRHDFVGATQGPIVEPVDPFGGSGGGSGGAGAHVGSGSGSPAVERGFTGQTTHFLYWETRQTRIGFQRRAVYRCIYWIDGVPVKMWMKLGPWMNWEPLM